MTLPAPLASLIFGVPRRSTSSMRTIAYRHEAAQNAFELRLELLLAGVHHHLGALAEDELLDFQEAPQIALVDLLGIHLEDLALVEENHLVDGVSRLFMAGKAMPENEGRES